MTKPSLSAMFVIIIAISLSLFTLTSITSAQSSTNISGYISTNTVWTRTSSPYTFTGFVTVANGASLLIEPGVTVNLNGFPFTVNGLLNATGTNTAKIYFNNPDSTNGLSAGLNSILSNCIYNGTLTLSGSAKISNSIITGTIRIKGGAPTISNNTIPNTRRIFDGIDFLETQTITPGYGAYAFIADNTISGCWRGIAVNAGNTAIIERNYIYNNSWGIVNGPNSWEITTGANSTILNNTITANVGGIGVMGNFSPTIAFNNLQGNSEFSVSTAATSADYPTARTTCPLDVNAAYNYWGTINPKLIDQMIKDHKNYTGSGTIYYQPILTTPSTQSMPAHPSLAQPISYSPLPFQTPIPSSTSTPNTHPTLTPTQTPTSSHVDIIASATLNVEPNPVPIGTTATITLSLSPPPPPQLKFHALIAMITAPDGTVSTLGPYFSDSSGITHISYFPTQYGNYGITFSYPGETFSSTTFLAATCTSSFQAISSEQSASTPIQSSSPTAIQTPTPLSDRTNSPTESPQAPTPTPTELLVIPQNEGASTSNQPIPPLSVAAFAIAFAAIVAVGILLARLFSKTKSGGK